MKPWRVKLPLGAVKLTVRRDFCFAGIYLPELPGVQGACRLNLNRDHTGWGGRGGQARATGSKPVLLAC